MSWIEKDYKKIVADEPAKPTTKEENEKQRRQKREDKFKQDAEILSLKEEVKKLNLDNATPEQLIKALQDIAYGKVGDKEFDILVENKSQRVTSEKLQRILSSSAKKVANLFRYKFETLLSPEQKASINKIKALKDKPDSFDERVEESANLYKMLEDDTKNKASYLYQAFIETPESYKQAVEKFYNSRDKQEKKELGSILTSPEALLHSDKVTRESRYLIEAKRFVNSFLSQKEQEELTELQADLKNAEQYSYQQSGAESIERDPSEEKMSVVRQKEGLYESIGGPIKQKLEILKNIANTSEELVVKKMDLEKLKSQLVKGSKQEKAVVKIEKMISALKEQLKNLDNELDFATNSIMSVLSSNGSIYEFLNTSHRSGLSFVNNTTLKSAGAFFMGIKEFRDFYLELTDEVNRTSIKPSFAVHPEQSVGEKKSSISASGKHIYSEESMKQIDSLIGNIENFLNQSEVLVSEYSQIVDSVSEEAKMLEQINSMSDEQVKDESIVRKIVKKLSDVSNNVWTKIKSIFVRKNSWLGESTWLK